MPSLSYLFHTTTHYWWTGIKKALGGALLHYFKPLRFLYKKVIDLCWVIQLWSKHINLFVNVNWWSPLLKSPGQTDHFNLGRGMQTAFASGVCVPKSTGRRAVLHPWGALRIADLCSHRYISTGEVRKPGGTRKKMLPSTVWHILCEVHLVLAAECWVDKLQKAWCIELYLLPILDHRTQGSF